MQQDYLKRVLKILFPITILGFLLISISLTFGTSKEGIALGFLEGVLVLLGGVWIVFAQPINSFLKRTVIDKIAQMIRKINARRQKNRDDKVKN